MDMAEAAIEVKEEDELLLERSSSFIWGTTASRVKIVLDN